MNSAATPLNPENSLPTSVQLLHAILRFGRVVRYRWTYVAASLVVSALLGMLYFLTADRIYQAKAQLLVQQTGPVVMSNSTPQQGHQQGMLPTYEQLFKSTVVLEGAIQRLRKQPREYRVDLTPIPADSWVNALRENLSVRSFRLTNVIEIAYFSKDPDAAEAVVDAIVTSYIDFMQKNHQNVAANLVQILHSERESVEARLTEKERELLAAKKRFGDLGLRDTSKSLHPLVQRVIRINESLIEVQQNRLKLQASYAAIQDSGNEQTDLRQHLMALEPVIGREAVLSALGLSEQDSQTVARLEQKLIDEQNELSSLEPHYGRRHPKVTHLATSVHQTRVYLANYQEAVEQRSSRLQSPQMRTMLTNLVAQELRKAWSQEEELKRQYELAQADAVQLRGQFEEIAMIEREVERLLTLNHTLLDRIANIGINENQTDVRVEKVSPSDASPHPVKPRAILVLAASLFMGSTIGAGLVYIADVLDDRFRSPDEIKDQLNTTVLAMVRQIATSATSGLSSLIVHESPDSVESEAFRTLRTTLAFTADQLNCVAVTSSEPGDGKTTVAANLGVSFAQAGKKTLIIDADLRRPGLTQLMKLKGQNGLSDVLKLNDPLSIAARQTIRNSGQPGLDILPSGSRPLDPTGLLTSTRFGELLGWAESEYDQILIDSPPLLVASDATIVGRLADGLILVVQPQKNHRRLVMRAVEEVRSVGLNFAGIVVNRLTADGGDHYYGKGYGYGYGYGYGAPYGEEPDTDALTSTAPETRSAA